MDARGGRVERKETYMEKIGKARKGKEGRTVEGRVGVLEEGHAEVVLVRARRAEHGVDRVRVGYVQRGVERRGDDVSAGAVSTRYLPSLYACERRKQQ